MEAPPALVLPLRADAVRRALTNLVDNARRHARRIALGAMRQDERVVQVTVDDDGPGIPPERARERCSARSRPAQPAAPGSA